jgi:hypothetical protein
MLCAICRSIGVYTSSDGNHLTLDLCMKNTDGVQHDGSANLVEFSLAIKHQEGGNHWKATGSPTYLDDG